MTDLFSAMVDRKANPIVTDHPCCAPTCRRWGSFGIMGDTFARSRWFCMDHLPTGQFEPVREYLAKVAGDPKV